MRLQWKPQHRARGAHELNLWGHLLMRVLGIETSCDETAAAVVDNGREVRSSVVSSQVSLHAGYGGVVPELAAREHLRNIVPVVDDALSKASCGMSDIDAIAVTRGPGLVPALLVGVSYSKGVALATGKPFVGINHFLAHIYGAFFDGWEILDSPASFPVLALVVSGGHTALVFIQHDGAARIVGSTLDDAAGEAFDKAARILELGYPGGPVIDRLAREGNPDAVAFPRSLTGRTGRAPRPEDRLNFSFSGVKTALLYAVRERTLSERELLDTVASYQEAIVDVLVLKTVLAAQDYQTPTVVLCGGVACNSRLRTKMAAGIEELGRTLVAAQPRFCTDNAAMVAGLACHSVRNAQTSDLDLTVSARLDHDLGRVTFTSSP